MSNSRISIPCLSRVDKNSLSSTVRGVQFAKAAKRDEIAALLVAKWSIHAFLGSPDDDVADEGKVYCICQDRDRGGPMIACDGPLPSAHRGTHCVHPRGEWFHLACMALPTAPKGTWRCPQCAPLRSRPTGTLATARSTRRNTALATPSDAPPTTPRSMRVFFLDPSMVLGFFKGDFARGLAVLQYAAGGPYFLSDMPGYVMKIFSFLIGWLPSDLEVCGLGRDVAPDPTWGTFELLRMLQTGTGPWVDEPRSDGSMVIRLPLNARRTVWEFGKTPDLRTHFGPSAADRARRLNPPAVAPRWTVRDRAAHRRRRTGLKNAMHTADVNSLGNDIAQAASLRTSVESFFRYIDPPRAFDHLRRASLCSHRPVVVLCPGQIRRTHSTTSRTTDRKTCGVSLRCLVPAACIATRSVPDASTQSREASTSSARRWLRDTVPSGGLLRSRLCSACGGSSRSIRKIPRSVSMTYSRA